MPALILSLGLVGAGLFLSTLHPGKPLRFYRGFNNLRHSPVAREGAGVVAFMGFASLHLLCRVASQAWLTQQIPGLATLTPQLLAGAWGFGTLALIGAGVGLFYMYRC